MTQPHTQTYSQTVQISSAFGHFARHYGWFIALARANTHRAASLLTANFWLPELHTTTQSGDVGCAQQKHRFETENFHVSSPLSLVSCQISALQPATSSSISKWSPQSWRPRPSWRLPPARQCHRRWWSLSRVDRWPAPMERRTMPRRRRDQLMAPSWRRSAVSPLKWPRATLTWTTLARAPMEWLCEYSLFFFSRSSILCVSIRRSSSCIFWLACWRAIDRHRSLINDNVSAQIGAHVRRCSCVFCVCFSGEPGPCSLFSVRLPTL